MVTASSAARREEVRVWSPPKTGGPEYDYQVLQFFWQTGRGDTFCVAHGPGRTGFVVWLVLYFVGIRAEASRNKTETETHRRGSIGG